AWVGVSSCVGRLVSGSFGHRRSVKMEKVSRRSALRAATAGAVVVGTAVLGGTTAGDEPKAPKLWTLEGELKVHPKYLYRYYLVLSNESGQKCALYGS